MITIITILTVSGILLTIILYINERIITKLPNDSKVLKFWRRHICSESEEN